LKVVKIIWQKENQVKNVEEIFKQCGALYDKFVGFAEDMLKIKAKLKDTSDTYDNAMNKKDGKKRGDTIIGRLEKIKHLEATTNKTMPQALLTEIELLEEDDEGTLSLPGYTNCMVCRRYGEHRQTKMKHEKPVSEKMPSISEKNSLRKWKTPCFL
ncbi:MAG TPA: DNA recombination protein RmuC, partial [Agriterribacter sp.]|uniref:DNA recombination protein RmuC n=1 Tax=Agriterribacter sp. TaxID=2821509 RepID=UPI002C6EF86F